MEEPEVMFTLIICISTGSLKVLNNLFIAN
jgi:hypothetical protein